MEDRLASFFAENFCRESLQGCILLPGIERKSRFAAGLFEESNAVPVVLKRDLRQQKAAMTMLADEQAMAANFDFFDANWLRSRENTQLDFKMRSFEFGDRRKSIVVKSGGTSCFCYGAIQRKLRQNVADTAAQFSAQIE